MKLRKGMDAKHLDLMLWVSDGQLALQAVHREKSKRRKKIMGVESFERKCK